MASFNRFFSLRQLRDTVSIGCVRTDVTMSPTHMFTHNFYVDVADILSYYLEISHTICHTNGPQSIIRPKFGTFFA
jgi:hypothetical protein